MSNKIKDICAVSVVFCIIFILVTFSVAGCYRLTRETNARLCADYGYECDKEE